MKYALLINPKVEKVLSKIEAKMALKIRDKIRELADDPRPASSKKLEGHENAYRKRVGDYRIIYEIYAQKVLILIVNIGHRKEIYE